MLWDIYMLRLYTYNADNPRSMDGTKELWSDLHLCADLLERG